MDLFRRSEACGGGLDFVVVVVAAFCDSVAAVLLGIFSFSFSKIFPLFNLTQSQTRTVGAKEKQQTEPE